MIKNVLQDSRVEYNSMFFLQLIFPSLFLLLLAQLVIVARDIRTVHSGYSDRLSRSLSVSIGSLSVEIIYIQYTMFEMSSDLG